MGQSATTPPFSDALHSPDVIHGSVKFTSGDETIDGYLARPKAGGRHPIVLVIAGNTIAEDYIRNTTALLASAGFVGLAPNIYALQTETMSAQEQLAVLANQITDDRIFRDCDAALGYLKTQPDARSGRIGMTGFCFGGRGALMYAARSKTVGAVVPFYGNLRTPPAANRNQDPLDVLANIKAPVQGHFALDDREIPMDQIETFAGSLKARHVPVEIYTYKAPHGFFAYTRASYDAEAARLSWARAVAFLHQYLK